MSDIDFGRTVSPQDAELADIPDVPNDSQKNTNITQQGNAVWEYHNLGSINGIPVEESALNLPVERDDLIDVAFTLKRIPKSKIFWMSPEDEESIKLYDDLLEQQSANRIQLMDEIKQYDMNKGKFLVWLRYDELTYVLVPRFAYLKEELENG